jgi:hypothetical protein
MSIDMEDARARTTRKLKIIFALIVLEESK